MLAHHKLAKSAAMPRLRRVSELLKGAGFKRVSKPTDLIEPGVNNVPLLVKSSDTYACPESLRSECAAYVRGDTDHLPHCLTALVTRRRVLIQALKIAGHTAQLPATVPCESPIGVLLLRAPPPDITDPFAVLPLAIRLRLIAMLRLDAGASPNDVIPILYTSYAMAVAGAM